jgi:hypothetical protein
VAQDAAVIEYVAIAMAASVGIAWGSASGEQASRFRIMANAALMRQAIAPGTEIPEKHLLDTIAGIITALRDAASRLEDYGETGGLVDRLWRTKATVGVLAALLDPPTEPEVEEVV